jgi:hypothetical protein
VNGANGARIRFEPDAFPSLSQQIRGIPFDAMASADLDEKPIGGADAPKDLAGDPVFTVLREYLCLEVREVARVGIPGRLQKL